MIKLENQGERIVVWYKDGLCGYISPTDEEGYSPYNEIKELVKAERIAEITGKVGRNYVGIFSVNDEKELQQLSASTLDGVVEQIIKEGLVTQEEVNVRMKYLLKYGVTKKQMVTLFKSFKAYDLEVSKRIPTPETLYVDSSGLLREVIGYVNSKFNMLFEGDRGVGKNVLTETIAWLTKRPLYEFPMNSQHDNSSLLGGKTITSEETENGQVVTTGFEPEAIVQAVEVGGILVFDEFNTSLGHILSVFNSLLDERRRLQVPGYKMVVADDNFLSIATQNKDYQGTFENNEATIDRFTPIIFPPSEKINDLLLSKVPGINYEILSTCNELYSRMRKCVKDGQMEEKVISIRGFICACRAVEEDVPLKNALISNIANKASDLDTRSELKSMIEKLVK